MLAVGSRKFLAKVMSAVYVVVDDVNGEMWLFCDDGEIIAPPPFAAAAIRVVPPTLLSIISHNFRFRERVTGPLLEELLAPLLDDAEEGVRENPQPQCGGQLLELLLLLLLFVLLRRFLAELGDGLVVVDELLLFDAELCITGGEVIMLRETDEFVVVELLFGKLC